MNQAAAQPDALLGWMGSLSDPKRLRILRLLERQELGVAELCDVLQTPQSTVSRHLKVLSDLGWLKSRQQGTNHLYRIILDELEPAARKIWLVAREQIDRWPTAGQDQLRLGRLLRDRQVDSQAFFAGVAAEWDRLRRELYGEHFSISALLSLLPTDYIIADLGCGSGHLTAELAPHVKQVLGIDSSGPMLKAARRRTSAFSNVTLSKGDLTALPIQTAFCDAALLVLALTYVAAPQTVLSELARILKPEGRAVIVDLLPHDREDFRRQMGQMSLGVSQADIQRWMTEAGFSSFNLRALAPESQAKGPAIFLATASRNPKQEL